MRATFLLFVISLIGCVSHSQLASDQLTPEGYPTRWWTFVDPKTAPSWEILPQEAGPGEVILSKRNELGLLSNFAATPFTYHGKTYASLEGFWQAMLYPESADDVRAKAPGIQWKFTRAQVEKMTAFDAKHAGEAAKSNMQTMGIDWVSFEGEHFVYRSVTPGVHYRLIVEATHAKLEQNKNVQDVLKATGTLHLRPDHHEDESIPEWRFYEIYENIRDQQIQKATATK